jgi:hypothetical protein
MALRRITLWKKRKIAKNRMSDNSRVAEHVEALSNAEFSEACEWLTAFRSRTEPTDLPSEISSSLAQLKATYVASKNQACSKAIWCLQTVGLVQYHYLNAFALMTAARHYAAWCELERAEVCLHSLDRHLRDPENIFGLELVRNQIHAFQCLYPYKFFASPEIWHKECRCSVCDQIIKPRSRCHHRPGEIYDGEECFTVIKQMEFLAIAIVMVPVQKYSVIFEADPAVSGGEPNPLAYQMVQCVLRGLASPWNRFGLRWQEKRQPHSLFADTELNDTCPCIAPKGSYLECCRPTEGVLRPHLLIDFESQPPSDLQQEIFIQ